MDQDEDAQPEVLAANVAKVIEPIALFALAGMVIQWLVDPSAVAWDLSSCWAS